jgi:hypothetical protein
VSLSRRRGGRHTEEDVGPGAPRRAAVADTAAMAEAAAGAASVAGARVRRGTRREGKGVGKEWRRSGRVGVLPRFDWTYWAGLVGPLSQPN